MPVQKQPYQTLPPLKFPEEEDLSLEIQISCQSERKLTFKVQEIIHFNHHQVVRILHHVVGGEKGGVRSNC